MRIQRIIRIGPCRATSVTHSVFTTRGPCRVSEAPQLLQMLGDTHFLFIIPVGDDRVK